MTTIAGRRSPTSAGVIRPSACWGVHRSTKDSSTNGEPSRPGGAGRTVVRVRRVGTKSRDEGIDYSGDEGCVVANEISAERAGMLVHQIARRRQDFSASPFFDAYTPNDRPNTKLKGRNAIRLARHQSLYPLVVFTSHDARYFPSLRREDGREVLFDRILCDVMCSSVSWLHRTARSGETHRPVPSTFNIDCTP